MTIRATDLLSGWIRRRTGVEEAWFDESLARLEMDGAAERDLHIFLGLAPRRLGKGHLALSDTERASAETVLPGWRPASWSLDGAARVLALARFGGRRSFAEVFKDLRRTADAAELVALYRGLPLYPEPEALHFEVGEGLRSNLVPVFTAVAHDNPFPARHFDERRWNHMILKALFIGVPLSPIVRLTGRANPELARILLEYARERRSAGRPVPEELWPLVEQFRGRDGIADERGEHSRETAP